MNSNNKKLDGKVDISQLPHPLSIAGKIPADKIDEFVEMFPKIAEEGVRLKESVQKFTGKTHLKPLDYKEYTKHQEKIAEESGIYVDPEKSGTEKKVYLEDRVEKLEKQVQQLLSKMESE